MADELGATQDQLAHFAVEAAKIAEEYAKTSPLHVYSAGMFCCSVCAPGEWTAEQVQAETNAVRICGTESGWTISTDATFKGGQPMPCVCESDPTRKHWLLDA